jgi:hypothetical protein
MSAAIYCGIFLHIDECSAAFLRYGKLPRIIVQLLNIVEPNAAKKRREQPCLTTPRRQERCYEIQMPALKKKNYFEER